MTRSQFAIQYGKHLGLTMFASMLVLPIFTPYMLSLGFMLQDIAITMMVMAFTIIVFEVPSGVFADALGRRKVFLSSLVFAALCNLTLLFSQHLWQLCAAMAFWGLSQASLTGTLNAWFVEAYQKLDGDEPLNSGFGKVYGLSYLIGASAALFATLFLAFMDASHFHLTSLYKALLVISIVVFIITFIRTFFIVRAQTAKQTDDVTPTLFSHCTTILNTCKERGMRKLLVILVFAVPVASSIEKFWPALAEQYSQVPVEALAWIFPAMLALGFALNGLAAALSTQLCRWFDQRLGYVMAFSHVFKLMFVVLLSWVSSVPMLILALVCFYFCMGLAQPAQLQLQHQLSSDNVRVSIESVTSLSTRLGGLLGTAMTALLITYTNLTNSWILLGGVSIIAIILCHSSVLNQNEQQVKVQPS
ncbi:MFS transporter [Pseudoalteromonas arctica]|uniref:MFS transporter n=1 Tax=Pseudoalteromonas arctica TaxID=394751 RepID=A0A7Y0HAY6_9GAMM|nr:MFS transporter [Pseudoalteromonas arctica]NMM41045.1 MFS transporter [Pseudoalteromonas arctica]